MMMNEDPRMINLSRTADGTYAAQGAFAKLMRRVYVWMTLALAVTGLMAAYISRDLQLLSNLSGGMMLGLVIAELALVMVLSAAIHRLSFAVTGLMFLAYSLLNGVTLSVVLLAYTATSVATAFFVTAGTFAAMTVVGLVVRKDLSGLGKFAYHFQQIDVVRFVGVGGKDRHGVSAGKHQGIVPLDIDVLQWNEQILKPADMKRDYVREALRSLLPET